MFEEIQKILAEHFRISKDKISRTTKLQEDLGADSLDYADLMMAFEEAFHMDIKDEEFEPVKTVKDIENYLLQNKGLFSKN